MPQLVGQSAQVSPSPVLPHQPTMRVYTTEDLGLGRLDFQYQDLLVDFELQMSILSPLGIGDMPKHSAHRLIQPIN